MVGTFVGGSFISDFCLGKEGAYISFKLNSKDRDIFVLLKLYKTCGSVLQAEEKWACDGRFMERERKARVI